MSNVTMGPMARITVALLCALAAGIALAAPAKHPARQVLPDTVVPTHYDLVLTPDAEKLTFTGKVDISVDVHTATADVSLNSVDLTFQHAKVDGSAAVVSLEPKLGRAKLHVARPLAPGRHTLSIDYSGPIKRSTLGFFAMDYASPDGPRRTLATNFEPAYARRLLPCWDEPGRKATFSIAVDAPRDRVAVSNMPVAATTALGSARQRVRFQQTPRMSTYLLFVAVGDFERVHQASDGVDVGVVVKRGDTVKAAYALAQAVALLHFYNDYFGVRFPLPKLDLIAAPGAIQGSSMENWGAIFYSQADLLFDPDSSTESDRQRVFEVVSHEMAHQWFGDLVTMAWWDNLWLNEGFARWMQTFAADELHPEWQTGLQAATIFEKGKKADSVPSTHPVVQEVFTPDQADEAFDHITYDKGAAVISMIESYVGRDAFRDGVRRYMHEHAFGNTVDSDLWSIIQQAAGKPILAIERDFTRQVGVPLVRVTRTDKDIQLAVSRFAQDPGTIAAEPPLQWRLPLSVGPVGGARQTVLLQSNTTLPAPSAGPLLVNAGQLGYARVLYDESFTELAARLGSLQPIDQLGLLNDAYALGTAGYAPAGRLLSLVTALPVDANPVTWTQVVGMLGEIERHYADTPQRAALRRFVLKALAPLAARLGNTAAPGEPSNITVLRGRLLELQATCGDQQVIERAGTTFAGGAGSPAEQRTALAIVAAHADAATFDALLSNAQQTQDPLGKQHIFEALARVVDPALGRRMMAIALGEHIPPGSGPELVEWIAFEHPDMAWQALEPRLDDPALRFDKVERWTVARTVAGRSSDPQRIVEMQAYEARSVPEEARQPFLEAEASIRQNQRFRATVLPELAGWIEARANN